MILLPSFYQGFIRCFMELSCLISAEAAIDVSDGMIRLRKRGTSVKSVTQSSFSMLIKDLNLVFDLTINTKEETKIVKFIFFAMKKYVL